MDQPPQFTSLPPIPPNRSIRNSQFQTISTPRYSNKRDLSFKKSDRLNLDSPLRKLNKSVQSKKIKSNSAKNPPQIFQLKQASSLNKSTEKTVKISQSNLLRLPSIEKRKNSQTIQLRKLIKGKRQNYGEYMDLDIDRDINSYKKQLFTRLDPKQYQLSIRTKAGIQGNVLKINQDIEIINQKLPFGIKLFCVCDGHGAYGHLVVAFIRERFIENLNSRLRKVQNIQVFQEEIYLAFQKTNNDLLLSDINTQLSGATVVAVFIHHEKLLCFNVGDSRAVFINYEYGFLKVRPISNDHKPSRSDEAKRVTAAGGRIQHNTNEKNQEIGPLRVWLKDIKSPGLAMTRSFGDKVGGRCGVIAQPEITNFEITNQQKYLLIGTDGLWQQIENHQVIKYVEKELREDKIEEAADKLLNKAIELWDEKYNTRDDITFILIKLSSLKKEIEQIEQ